MDKEIRIKQLEALLEREARILKERHLFDSSPHRTAFESRTKEYEELTGKHYFYDGEREGAD